MKVKHHDSDGEDENDEIDMQEQESAIETKSQFEIEKEELENAPVISSRERSPAAFIFSPSRKERDQILFTEESQKVKCPHCDAVSHSIIAYETNFLGYLLAIFAILFFGILSMFMMPFLVGLTKQGVHKCAKCLNDVKQSSWFGLNSLEDQVVATQVGNMGIILTRRYLLYMVMCIGVLLGIYGFINMQSSMHQRHISNLQWPTYLKDCGYESYQRNPRMAYRKFDMFHFGRQVSWTGHVVRVKLDDDNPMSVRYHSSQILVKMVPDDTVDHHGPDLGVTFSEKMLEKYSEVVENLKIGDNIRFNATLLTLGDKHHLHHLRAFYVEKIDGHKDVWAAASGRGRYKLKIDHKEADEQEIRGHKKSQEINELDKTDKPRQDILSSLEILAGKELQDHKSDDDDDNEIDSSGEKNTQ